jgi:anti-sigma factor RsiW
MSTCSKAEALRDYAFDELPAGDRPSMEQHIAACADCAAELDQLRVTTAALRIIPDREIPQRIAFVSDKVFAPSAAARFFGAFWNSAARLGFASACILGGALMVSAYHRPAEIRTVVQTAGSQIDVTKAVNDAVAQAVAKVRTEDAQVTKSALEAVERKDEAEHRTLLEAVTVLQDRLNTGTLLASADYPAGGARQ